MIIRNLFNKIEFGIQQFVMKIALSFFLFTYFYLSLQQTPNNNKTTCPFGFFATPTNVCVECLTTCPKCQYLQDKCQTCSEGLRSTINKMSCDPCGKGELTCTNRISCQRYYSFDGRACKPICTVKNCLDCSSIITTVCSRCQSDYRLSPDNRQCINKNLRVSNNNIGRNLQQDTMNSASRLDDIFRKTNIAPIQPARTNIPQGVFLDPNQILNMISSGQNFGLNQIITNTGSSFNQNLNSNSFSAASSSPSISNTQSFSSPFSANSNSVTNTPANSFSSSSTSSSPNIANSAQGSSFTSTPASSFSNTPGANTVTNLFAGTLSSSSFATTQGSGSTSNPSSTFPSSTSNQNLLPTGGSSISGSNLNSINSNSLPSNSNSFSSSSFSQLNDNFGRVDLPISNNIINRTQTLITSNTGSGFSASAPSTTSSSIGTSNIGTSSSSTSLFQNSNNQGFSSLNVPIVPINSGSTFDSVVASTIQFPSSQSTFDTGTITTTETRITNVTQNVTQIISGPVFQPTVLTPVQPIVNPIITREQTLIVPNTPIVPRGQFFEQNVFEQVVVSQTSCKINQYLSAAKTCLQCNQRCLTCINSADQCLECSQRYTKRGWKCISNQFVPFNYTLKVPKQKKGYALGQGINEFKQNFIKFVLPQAYAGSSLDIISLDLLAYDQAKEQLLVSGVVDKIGTTSLLNLNNTITNSMVRPSINLWPFGIINSSTLIKSNTTNSTNVPPGNTVAAQQDININQKTGSLNLAAILIPSILGGILLLGSIIGLVCCYIKKLCCFSSEGFATEKTIPQSFRPMEFNKPQQPIQPPTKTIIQPVPPTAAPASIPDIFYLGKQITQNRALQSKMGQVPIVLSRIDHKATQIIQDTKRVPSIDNIGSSSSREGYNGKNNFESYSKKYQVEQNNNKLAGYNSQAIRVLESNNPVQKVTITSLPTINTAVQIIRNPTIVKQDRRMQVSVVKPINMQQNNYGYSNMGSGYNQINTNSMLESKAQTKIIENKPKSIVKINKVSTEVKQIFGGGPLTTDVNRLAPGTNFGSNVTISYGNQAIALGNTQALNTNLEKYNAITYVTSQKTINEPTYASRVRLNDTISNTPTSGNLQERIMQKIVVYPGGQVAQRGSKLLESKPYVLTDGKMEIRDERMVSQTIRSVQQNRNVEHRLVSSSASPFNNNHINGNAYTIKNQIIQRREDF